MANLRKISGRALVVEDDALIAMAMADILTDLGMGEVQTCASSADAMALLAEFRPDVLTLDVNLADRQDGWALAELAQHISTTPPIIIFATGSPESVPPLVARMGYVIAKPFDPAAIHTILRKAQKDRGLLGRMRRILGDNTAG
jgi:DNA-binding NtrC family response regulator